MYILQAWSSHAQNGEQGLIVAFKGCAPSVVTHDCLTELCLEFKMLFVAFCIEPFPPSCRKMATDQARLSGSMLRGLDTQGKSRVKSKTVYCPKSVNQADNRAEVPNHKQAWRLKQKTSSKTS